MFSEHERTVQGLKFKLKESEKHIDNIVHFIRSSSDNRKRTLVEFGFIEARGFSLLEVLGEARRTAHAILSLRPARFANLSSERLNALLTASHELNSDVRAFHDECTSLIDDNRTYLFEQAGRVVTFLSREEMYNFAPRAEKIFNSLEMLRSAASGLSLVSTNVQVEEKIEENLSELLSRASNLLRDIQDVAQAATEARDSANQKMEEFTILSDRLSEEGEALTENARQIGTNLTNINESAVTTAEAIRTHEENISARRSHISELAEASEGDRQKLSDFSAELSDTQDRLKKLHQTADQDKKKQDEHLVHAEKLIEKAEDMVSGATVAGLAKAFDEERKELQSGMNNAMIWFFVGIAFLFIVTFLLAAYVFEIPFTIAGIKLSGNSATEAVGDEVTVAGVLSRTIILLAPFWLTLFSARRYRNLFDLRQQYSHKYNLAFSIDGFRKQAPSYGEDLAAWVFHEISQRPVTGNSSKMGENPLPTLESIVAATTQRTNFFKSDKKTED